MLINNEFTENKIQSPLQYAWVIFKRNNIAFAAMWGVIILLFIAIFADSIDPFSLQQQYIQQPLLLPPYWSEGGNSINILGTDDLGRDVLVRLLQGIQLTLGGALIITLFIALLGTAIGATAALSKGIKACVLNHFLDTFLIIPTLLSALIIIIFFGASFENCLIAVSLSLLPQFIREIYHSIKEELNKQYIISLRLDGATNLRLFRFGILPNIIEPIITSLNRIFTMAILEISTLGFLGFGSQSLDAELGASIASSIELIYSSPRLVLFPGFALFFTIFIFNIFAEGLRHAIIDVEDE